MRGVRRLAILPAVLALLLCLIGGTALAESVAVDIGVVLASNAAGPRDPALKAIQPKLDAMFRYSSYRMLDRKRKVLGVGEEGVFELPGNRTARVTPAAPSGNKVRLSVQVTEGSRNLLTTTLGMTRGGMVLLGGFPYQDGVMILFVSTE